MGVEEGGRDMYRLYSWGIQVPEDPPRHRWELPVLRYHSIRGNFYYPFLGVIISVILHDFIRQKFHKNQSDSYPFSLVMVNYPTFLINYHILYFQMYNQYLFIFQEYSNNLLTQI